MEIDIDMQNNMKIDTLINSGSSKSGKNASQVAINFFCELQGYDIKTLNTTTGKGSYMLKILQKKISVPYTHTGKVIKKNVTVNLYKLKGLRGFLRRAAELRLLELFNEGKIDKGPCTPTANYPHREILDRHLENGYHLQGTCNPFCYVRRVYGSLDYRASLKVFPPYVAKATVENLPAKVDEYLEDNIEAIFGLHNCVVYHNESTLKTETFNIIDRTTELAVNNFMKHCTSGVFPFRIVFTSSTTGSSFQLLENIGFFIDSLFEIEAGKVQLGADKNNGSGQVKINVKAISINRKFSELERFIAAKNERVYTISFGNTQFQKAETEYTLDSRFGKYCLELFTKKIGE